MLKQTYSVDLSHSQYAIPENYMEAQAVRNIGEQYATEHADKSTEFSVRGSQMVEVAHFDLLTEAQDFKKKFGGWISKEVTFTLKEPEE